LLNFLDPKKNVTDKSEIKKGGGLTWNGEGERRKRACGYQELSRLKGLARREES